MRFHHVSGAVTILATCMGCAHTGGSDYFPMDQASKWEYTEYITTAYRTNQSTSVHHIEGREEVNGTIYDRLVDESDAAETLEPNVVYFRKTKDGIFLIDDADDDRNEYLYLPFPLDVGDRWTTKTVQGEVTYRVEACEDVALASVTYEDCLKVAFDGTQGSIPFSGYVYYAKGVGLVRQVVLKSGEPFYELILRRHDP